MRAKENRQEQKRRSRRGGNMNRKLTGITLVFLTVVHMAGAVDWVADVPAGAAWSDANNWSGGVPKSTDLALFNTDQANTYNVDVDTAAVTRLLQVMRSHTFSGSGSIRVTTVLGSTFQNCFLASGSDVAATVNVPISFNISSSDSTYYGQLRTDTATGGTTKFNGAFTVENGTAAGLSLRGGTVEFNGDLTLNDAFRLSYGTMVIGGSGTTSIGGSGFILTSGVGTELHLNRTGAYTVADTSTGRLQIERSRVYLNASQAVGENTNVRIYGLDAATALVSGGNYNQNFGWLDCEGPARFDMGNDAVIWTFADSSSQSWDPSGDGELIISNVDVDNTVIRFAIDGGTGLTEEQVGQITLNGQVLTLADTTVDGGYLYITQAIPEPATFTLFLISSCGILVCRRYI